MILAMRSAWQLFLPCTLAAFSLTGCLYRMNIQQGNYLEGRALDQLQVGMTRSQVRYLLGTPMVPEAFDDSRWDYLYFLRQGHLSKPVQSHLIVYFDDDKVSKIDKTKANATRSVLSEPVMPKAPDATPSAPQDGAGG